MFVTTVDIGDAFKLGKGEVCLFRNPITKQCFFSVLSPNRSIKQVPAYQSLGSFISAILPTVFVISGIILFILIVLGGLMMVVNAGSGDAKKTEQGKNALTAALTGMAVIFCAWWIIKIIEFITGIKIF